MVGFFFPSHLLALIRNKQFKRRNRYLETDRGEYSYEHKYIMHGQCATQVYFCCILASERLSGRAMCLTPLTEFLSAGSRKYAEVRSPMAEKSLSDNVPRSPSIATAHSGYSSNSSAPTAGTTQDEIPNSGNGVNGVVRNVLLDMPCVSTRGDGPGGKKIEGFLYRYKKGEEVKIVCVCHGRFLSPAEFVKHAGGSDVLHPLKHIVVDASPFFQ